MLGSPAMTFRTLVSLVRDGRLLVLLAMTRAVRPYHRLAFLAAGASSGLFAKLASGPLSLDRLADELSPTRRCATDWRPGSGSAFHSECCAADRKDTVFAACWRKASLAPRAMRRPPSSRRSPACTTISSSRRQRASDSSDGSRWQISREI